MIILNDNKQAYYQLKKYILDGNFSKIFILCDDNTKKDCLPLLVDKLTISDFKSICIEIEHGEQNKNIKTCEKIWKKLLQNGCDRKSLMINLGGGVVTDIGGFAASVYKRGIRFINIPTTLLAMVDASIGGKTGVDFNDLKNMIGTFCSPEMTFIDIRFLKTLDTFELKSGFAEMLKHGLIQNKKHWEELIHYGYNSINYTLLKDSINIKNRIIENDPYESEERKLLNFGHSIGHGIEAYSLKYDNPSLSHGESIAAGMIMESYLSMKMNLLYLEEFQMIEQNVKKYFGITNLSPPSFNKIVEFINNDKKNRNNNFYFVLLTKIGNAKYDVKIELNMIFDSLKYYSNLKSFS